MLEALEPHHLADALIRTPPQHRAVDERAAERLECRPCEALAFLGRHAREALLEVDARHAPALRNRPEEQRAHAIADRRQGAERQSVHEPQQNPYDTALHVGGAPPARIL